MKVTKGILDSMDLLKASLRRSRCFLWNGSGSFRSLVTAASSEPCLGIFHPVCSVVAEGMRMEPAATPVGAPHLIWI